MKITITEAAMQKINEKTAGKKGFLKLKYDTEGCGCVMNGVTDLWFVDQLEEDDYEIIAGGKSIYVEKSKEVFLDEELMIDFVPSTNSFQLKSPNQYLNPRMRLVIKIEQ